MGPERPSPLSAEALLAHAETGGPGAALAARRAAILAEHYDLDLARRALNLAISLDPMDPSPRLGLARLHAEAGDLDGARNEAAAVLRDGIDQAARARAAYFLGELARLQGESGEARSHFDAVLRIEDALLAGNRSDPTAARWYARARGRIAELDAEAGEMARARGGAEGALAMLRAAAAQVGEPPVLAADIADAEVRLAALELDASKPASARRRLGEAIGRYEALAVTEKTELHWRSALAHAWALAAEADFARGAGDHARDAMDKALQVRVRLAAADPREGWALAGLWRTRGALRAALGDHVVASDSLAQARALAQQLATRDAGAEAPARFLVHTLLEQADQAVRSGVSDLALDAANTARALAETRTNDTLANPDWLALAAAAWDRLGECARLAGSTSPMLDAFARAVEFRRLAAARDTSTDRQRGLAAALVKYGEAALAATQNETSRAAFSESASIRLRLAEASPGDARAALSVAAALERLGIAAMALGDRASARAAWEDELILAEQIFPDERALDGIRFRAIVEGHLAGAGGAQAEDHRRAALARFDTLAQAGALTEREAALRRKLWGG